MFDINTFTKDGAKVESYDYNFSTWNSDFTAFQYEGETINVIGDGYFHESEYRSAPYFDIRIDGITEFTEAGN